MSEAQIILICIVSFLAGCIVAVTLSRINGFDSEPDAIDMAPEPLGDMVNVSKIHGWHDDIDSERDLKSSEGWK